MSSPKTCTFNLIGAGRLGKTLGKLLHDHSLITLQFVCNQTLTSAQSACEYIGAGTAVESLSDLKPADLTLIAVPDNQIPKVCHDWLQSPAARTGSIVFHTSGAYSASLLDEAKSAGIFTASAHPLKSFADSSRAYETFAGTFCALEGDEEAVKVLSKIFESIGGKVGSISRESKTQYHAACVLACGGLTALYASCEKLLMDSGLPAELVQSLLLPYMKQTLENNAALGPAQALTGPVARGDQLTIEAHEKALQGDDLDLYRALTKIARGL